MTQVDLLKKAETAIITRSGSSLYMVHVIIDGNIIPLEPEQGEPLLNGQVRNKSFKTRPGVHFCKKGNGYSKVGEIKETLRKINRKLNFYIIDRMWIKESN